MKWFANFFKILKKFERLKTELENNARPYSYLIPTLCSSSGYGLPSGSDGATNQKSDTESCDPGQPISVEISVTWFYVGKRSRASVVLMLWKKETIICHILSYWFNRAFISARKELKFLKIPKGTEFFHKLYFSNLYIFATQCRRPLIFQTMNSVRPNNLSLKYQRFTYIDCKDVLEKYWKKENFLFSLQLHKSEGHLQRSRTRKIKWSCLH